MHHVIRWTWKREERREGAVAIYSSPELNREGTPNSTSEEREESRGRGAVRNWTGDEKRETETFVKEKKERVRKGSLTGEQSGAIENPDHTVDTHIHTYVKSEGAALGLPRHSKEREILSFDILESSRREREKSEREEAAFTR